MTTPDDTMTSGTSGTSGTVRTVVVTGGGTGIGRATAAAFAAGGADVYIVGRRAGPLQETAAAIAATPVAGDLATPDGVAAVVAALPEQIDVLVNNAGGNTEFDGAPDGADELTATADAWNRNWAANVLTAVLTTTALRPRMGAGGRIVNVGSIASPRGAGSYGAAKAALESWTVSLAADVGRDGITVNLVAPGLIVDTEFFRGRLSDERRMRLIAATATGRAGTPDDVASVIAFLASPGAAHITAQVVHVNGGAHSGR